MIAITVGVDRDLRNVLRNWDRDILNELKKAHRHVANWVVWRARRFAPKDTYELVNTLVARGQQDGAYVFSKAAHAVTQHWGSRTRNIEGVKFVWNTIVANREIILKMYEKFVDNFWRKVNARLS